MTAPTIAQPMERATGVSRRAESSTGLLVRVGSDLVLICFGFWLAFVLRYEHQVGGMPAVDDDRPFASFLPVVLLLEAILLVVFALRGVYRLPRWTSFLDEASLVGSSAIIGFSALIVCVFYFRVFYFSRLIFLYALLLVLAMLIGKRLLLSRFRTWMRSRGRWVDRVLVVGAGPAGEQVMSRLIGRPELGYELVGFLEDVPVQANWAVATHRAVVRPVCLGTCRDLVSAIDGHDVDQVIVALPPTAHDRLYQVIEQCRTKRVPFMLVPDLFELSLNRVEVHHLSGLPLIAMKDAGIQGWNFALKRAFDVVVATLALTAGLIPMLIIALLIRLDSPGPIFFGQPRVGRHGRTFTCYKFRSMYHDADKEKERLAASTHYQGDPVMFKMKDDPRRTRVGRWLRRTSLDELPQIWNVLSGQMSIVGPRPHLPQEVARYEPWQRQRLATTPGITCLWQVNGRSHLNFDEQARLDLYYAEHWSLWLDLKIILRTVPAVLTGRGAY